MVQLSQKQIGQRIAKIRKFRGLSQTDLAKSIEISRPSLTQIELGRRNLNLLEFQKLAYQLGFLIDRFFAENFELVEQLQIDEHETEASEMRISEPSLKTKKFKNVLLYLLEKCVGRPNIDIGMLNKILYFADFNYYELYEEQLTGATYRKILHGPMPEKLDAILQKMIAKDEIQSLKIKYKDTKQIRYFPLVKADLTALKASETSVIDHVIEQFANFSATAMSDYTHGDMPWTASKEGEILNYELVFYRDKHYSVRNYEV
ncbi:MAG: type II toxin-antitoxin system antitoxin SocA domain-containing protein [Chitinophagales bacterium]